jgi:hypothetical protein
MWMAAALLRNFGKVWWGEVHVNYYVMVFRVQEERNVLNKKQRRKAN